MNVLTRIPRQDIMPRPTLMPSNYIKIVEPAPEECSSTSLLPEGNVKMRNYRMINKNIRVYKPTGDNQTSLAKEKLTSSYDLLVCSALSPPRTRILELLRPEDPGREALEAIVRPAPRRGLTRPLDEDTQRFLQRVLMSPNPPDFPSPLTPELQSVPVCNKHTKELIGTSNVTASRLKKQQSLADELQEAEKSERCAAVKSERCAAVKSERCAAVKSEVLRDITLQRTDMRDAFERDRLGKLALTMEDDDEEVHDADLTMAARRLDSLLAESRELHKELAGIQEDLQMQSARAYRCTTVARALDAESQELRFLDDLVALLDGDVKSVSYIRGWPFVIDQRQPSRNYVV